MGFLSGHDKCTLVNIIIYLQKCIDHVAENIDNTQVKKKKKTILKMKISNSLKINVFYYHDSCLYDYTYN